MLLFPPSETSSTIDIHRWWRGNPHVWAELTGWDVCHEGASFCSHYASHKLILRGILSFLLSSSAALLLTSLICLFSPRPTLSPLSVLLIFSFFSLLCSRCDALVHIFNLRVFDLCRTVAVAILYLGPCYYSLVSPSRPAALFNLEICKSALNFIPSWPSNLKQFCVKRRYVISNMKSRTLGW